MNSLSPKLASRVADLTYDLVSDKKPVISRHIRQSISFSFEERAYTGHTGGFLGIIGKSSTGFALIGEGKNQYKDDLIIALRGTHSRGDMIADANIGLKGAPNGAVAHAGFVNLFNSIKPQVRTYLLQRNKLPKTVHCVGHSLGGALASLFSSWLKTEFSLRTYLYTFGAPRVGLQGYADKHIDRSYRCTHGADPVPMFPLWPFVHSGSEYRLDASTGVVFSTHTMSENGNPGYVNTASYENWDSLQKISQNFFNKRVILDYNRRKEAAFNETWKDKILGAIITLLRDSGVASHLQFALMPTLTVYDILARYLAKIANISKQKYEQTKGIIGHILVFSGRAAIEINELSYHFIKWAFSLMKKKLMLAVQAALNSLN
ncbi:lipase family protein [Vibrio vulnificus]|uniref:lipase family protein n=1 Tax=Vibrio vulnificus TaxID=672 RepID=UPI000CD01AA9|nr:lipase [Vibrio vulnificus]